MPKLNFDNYTLYTETNLLNDSTRKKLIYDIEYEVKTRPVKIDYIPPLQTFSDLLKKYKTLHWKEYKKAILKFTSQYIDSELEFDKTWGNVSIPKQIYPTHTHTSDFSVVLYLQNYYPAYGTNIKGDFIIPGLENSVLMFDGHLDHSIVNMPYEIATKNRRISLVCNLNYAKKPRPALTL